MNNHDQLAQATKLLRGMQSALGSSRPDDADEAEAWDQIDEVCAALASLAPVAWHESGTPPDCPFVKGNEPVKLQWRDSQGRRCTAWKEAQEIGDAIEKVAALTAQCEVAEESLSIMHAQHKEESARIDELTAQCEGFAMSIDLAPAVDVVRRAQDAYEDATGFADYRNGEKGMRAALAAAYPALTAQVAALTAQCAHDFRPGDACKLGWGDFSRVELIDLVKQLSAETIDSATAAGNGEGV